MIKRVERSFRAMSKMGRFVSNLALKAVHDGQKIETREELAKILVAAAGHSAKKINYYYWWRRYREQCEFYRDE